MKFDSIAQKVLPMAVFVPMMILPTFGRRNYNRHHSNRPNSSPVASPTATPSSTPLTSISPTIPPLQNPGGTLDLLSGQNWSNIAGSSPQADGLHVIDLARAIVEQDGSEGQTNSPISLYGPVLGVKGDFSISAKLSAVNKSAVLHLYSTPPRIYDEFRFESAGVRIHFEGSTLSLQQWDGKEEDPVVERSYPIASKNMYELTIERRGTTLTFLVDGKSIGKLSNRDTFSSGQVWFGTDSIAGSYTLSSLKASPLTGGSVQLLNLQSSLANYPKDPAAWQMLANKKYPGKYVGAAISVGPLVGDSSYQKIALGGWYGQWTTENALKAQFVHPQPDTYTFQEADTLVDLAVKNNIAVHGHALVFGEANPKWMQDTPKEKREVMMTDHITKVVSHYATKYPGKVVSWDVVNEPLDEEFWDGRFVLRNHIWHQAMGESYIEKAFQTARAADPNALLFINEWGLEEESGRFEGMLQLVEKLLAKKVPIDGIGFQAHVYEKGDEVDPAELRKHFQQVAALGRKYGRDLKVRISEMDVYGRNSSLQTKQFADTMKVCMEEPNCVSFSMWGVSEKYGSTSWIDDDGQMYIGDGLPFDGENKPLNAVSAMQAVLK